MWFTVSGILQGLQFGWSLPDSKQECMRWERPIQSLLRMTASQWQSFTTWSSSNSWIDGVKQQHFCTHLSQFSCHSWRQKLETQGVRSQAESSIFVTGKQRANLAAVSALSLPGMLTWRVIQHRTILLPLLVLCTTKTCLMSAADIWIFYMNFSNRSIKKSSKYLLIAVATRIWFNVNLFMMFLICTHIQDIHFQGSSK